MKEFENFEQGNINSEAQNQEAYAKPLNAETADEAVAEAEAINEVDNAKDESVLRGPKTETQETVGFWKQAEPENLSQAQARPQAQPQAQNQFQSQGQPQAQFQTQTQGQAQNQNQAGQQNTNAYGYGYGYGYGAAQGTYGNRQPQTQQSTTQYGSQQYSAPQYGGNPYYAQNYGTAVPAKKKKKGLSLFLMVFAIVAVISLVAVGAYFAGNRHYRGNHVISSDSTLDNTGATESTSSEVSIPETIKYSSIIIDEYEGLSELYETCAKSCVTIKCTIKSSYYGYSYENTAIGSGFVITEDGYIVTNHHVIEDASEIKVVFYDDKEVEAKLVGSDALSDIAVLQIDEKGLVPIEIGDSSQLKVGDPVIAIGTPADIALAGTMSYGYISGVNRKIDLTNDYGQVVKTMTLIQTSATLNPGNSGGPLINLAGQVVGINALKLSTEYEGLGFALPMKEATNIINAIIAGEEVNNGEGSFVSGAAQLGITGGTVTDEVRKSYNLSEDCPDGVFVTQVNRGTAVYKAGLSVFDIITEFNGKKVATIEELKEHIAECKAGQTVTLTYYRPGRSGEPGRTETISFSLDSVG